MSKTDPGYNDTYNLDGNNFSDNGFSLSSPYAQTSGFFDAYKKLVDQQASLGSGDRQGLVNRLNSATDQFKTLFQNNVGRSATDTEVGQFLKDNAGSTIANSGNNGLGRSETDPEGVRNSIAQYIGDTFQQQSNDTATQKLSDLSTQAGGLADQYLEMGKKSLSDLSDSLRSYQTSLFDKLRPQLNLAAQAGGYQDSGGQTLQEKGALTDLGNQATATLLPYEQSIEQNANAIRYGGASAPYSLASSFAANQPSVTSSFGSGGLNFSDQNAFSNYNQQRQLQLMKQQMLNASDLWTNTQPSFGATLGNSFARNFGGNLGDLATSGIQGSASTGGSFLSGLAAA